MKKLILLILYSLIFTPIFAEEPMPLSRAMKTGEKTTLQGTFCIFNGTPPNVRFVTDENKIIGVGTEEDCENEDVSKILSFQQKRKPFLNIWETES